MCVCVRYPQWHLIRSWCTTTHQSSKMKFWHTDWVSFPSEQTRVSLLTDRRVRCIFFLIDLLQLSFSIFYFWRWWKLYVRQHAQVSAENALLLEPVESVRYYESGWPLSRSPSDERRLEMASLWQSSVSFQARRCRARLRWHLVTST